MITSDSHEALQWAVLAVAGLLIITSLAFRSRHKRVEDQAAAQSALRIADYAVASGGLMIFGLFFTEFVYDKIQGVPHGAALPSRPLFDVMDWFHLLSAVTLFVLSLFALRTRSDESRRRAVLTSAAISGALVAVTLIRVLFGL